MGLEDITKKNSWGNIDKKLKEKILKPNNAGFFSEEESNERSVRLVTGHSENLGYKVKFYWLVDRDDGTIVDAKFQTFGPPMLIGVADLFCDSAVSRNYQQAKMITLEKIDKDIFDIMHLAVTDASSKCLDIPISINANVNLNEDLKSPKSLSEWNNLAKKEKISLIEKVLDEEVRALIALDGGGVEIVDLKGDELLISYHGACSSCYSAFGSTLSFIQETLQKKVYEELYVTPEMDDIFNSDLD